jgi:hypothetical protein
MLFPSEGFQNLFDKLKRREIEDDIANRRRRRKSPLPDNEALVEGDKL